MPPTPTLWETPRTTPVGPQPTPPKLPACTPNLFAAPAAHLPFPGGTVEPRLP